MRIWDLFQGSLSLGQAAPRGTVVAAFFKAMLLLNANHNENHTRSTDQNNTKVCHL
jgi:hypothetical protein